MEINWINCAGRMPPDDILTIVKRSEDHFEKIHGSNFIFIDSNCEWTPYTEEDWSELNKS